MIIEEFPDLNVRTCFLLLSSGKCFCCKRTFWFEKFYAFEDDYKWAGDGICQHCCPNKLDAHLIITKYVPPPPPARPQLKGGYILTDVEYPH